MSTHAHSCSLTLTHVHSHTRRFSHVHSHVLSCTLIYTHICSCIHMFTDVYTCSLMFAAVHSQSLIYTHVYWCSLIYTDILMFTNVHSCTLVHTHYTHVPSSTLTFTCDDITVSLYFIVPINRSFHVNFVHWCTDEVPQNCGLKSCHIWRSKATHTNNIKYSCHIKLQNLFNQSYMIHFVPNHTISY